SVPDRTDGAPTVLFRFPGGGFGRKYHNLETLPGYSEAEFHCAAGEISAASDHLAVGESSQRDTFALTYAKLAAANHATGRSVVTPPPERFRYCYHWPVEERQLVEADLASYVPYSDVVRGDEKTPWGSATMPACAVTMMTDGSVAGEAATINVPVLCASGERD